MFTFYEAILMMSVRANDAMSNTTSGGKRFKSGKLTIPVSLNTFNFSVKLKFNLRLKVLKHR